MTREFHVRICGSLGVRFPGAPGEQGCAANPEAELELDADGPLVTVRPTAGETSSRNGELLLQLKRFAARVSGWKVIDSSGGFQLTVGSMRSPDASLVWLERWQALSPGVPASPMDCTTENTHVLLSFSRLELLGFGQRIT